MLFFPISSIFPILWRKANRQLVTVTVVYIFLDFELNTAERDERLRVDGCTLDDADNCCSISGLFDSSSAVLYLDWVDTFLWSLETWEGPMVLGGPGIPGGLEVPWGALFCAEGP